MTMAGGFLGSAKSRLLPASLPFRFFAAGAVFHVLLWAAVFVAAADFPMFRGGVGAPLAAVHVLTLGVLTTTAVGAAVQLLPVATTRPMIAAWPIRLAFWLLVPGIVALIAGMAAADFVLLVGGAAAASLGLLLFAWLLADNLRRAHSMAVVRAYGWAALAALVLLVVLGVMLSLDDRSGFLPDHAGAALAHMMLGAFGFMGMLALGFSHVLIPMFALSHSPDARRATAGFALAAAAVACGATGALAGAAWLQLAACVIAAGAVALHLVLMRTALVEGMRKRLGLSFVMVRCAWASLALTPIIGAAALAGWLGAGGPTLFGLVALGGWLMTFLLGILQRIVPFLASMHMSRATGGPPLLSDLGGGVPLRVHAVCHAAALAGLAAAIVLDSADLARLSALIGGAGALAFAAFIGGVVGSVVRGRASLPQTNPGASHVR